MPAKGLAKSFPGDADDREVVLVERDLLSHNVWVTTEAPKPQSITDHSDRNNPRMRALRFVGGLVAVAS